MFKRNTLIFALLSLLLIVGFGCDNQQSQTNESDNEELNQVAEKEENNRKSVDIIEKESMEEFIEMHPDYEKYRAKMEELTDDEIIALYEKSEENKHQITEDFTEEEMLILHTIPNSEYYEMLGMTESEVLNWFDALQDMVNLKIHEIEQYGFDSEEYEEYRNSILYVKPAFQWISDNYLFEEEYHNQVIEEIIDLINAHVEGDDDALFSLKYILYEMNAEFNPHTLTDSKANDVTLSNAVRIQNGKPSIHQYELSVIRE